MTISDCLGIALLITIVVVIDYLEWFFLIAISRTRRCEFPAEDIHETQQMVNKSDVDKYKTDVS